MSPFVCHYLLSSSHFRQCHCLVVSPSSRGLFHFSRFCSIYQLLASFEAENELEIEARIKGAQLESRLTPTELFSFVSTISPWKKINGISLYLAVTDKSPRNRLLVARSSEVDRYTESNDGPFLKERLIFRNLRCILNSRKCIHGDDNNGECWPDFSTTSVDEQGFSRVSSWTVGSLPGNLRARDVEWPTGSKHKTADFGRSSTSIEHFISYVRKFSPTTDRGTNRLFSGARSNERSNSSLKRVHLLHGRHFANCLIVGRDEELIKMGEETRLPRKIHSATIFLREKSGKFFSASHPLTLAARQKF